MTADAAAERIPAGFASPVLDAQASFRTLMHALAYPGRAGTLPEAAEAPAGWPPGLAVAALTLLDADTPVWLDETARSAGAAAFLRFHAGAPIVDAPADAAFAILLAPETAPYDMFRIGVDEYPDRSATLLIGLDALSGGARKRLAGPGIETVAEIAPPDALMAFWDAWRRNHALYPLGFDAFLFADRQVIGMPRGVAADPMEN